MKSRRPFLSGIVVGLSLSCLINLIDDSALDLNSIMTFLLALIIFIIVGILDHCHNSKN